MTPYTVTCDYGATGEGRTLIILYVLAKDHRDALGIFERVIDGGDFYVRGADVTEGFDFDCDVANLLVSPAVKKQLDANCYKQYSAVLHYNYS